MPRGAAPSRNTRHPEALRAAYQHDRISGILPPLRSICCNRTEHRALPAGRSPSSNNSLGVQQVKQATSYHTTLAHKAQTRAARNTHQTTPRGKSQRDGTLEAIVGRYAEPAQNLPQDAGSASTVKTVGEGQGGAARHSPKRFRKRELLRVGGAATTVSPAGRESKSRERVTRHREERTGSQHSAAKSAR